MLDSTWMTTESTRSGQFSGERRHYDAKLGEVQAELGKVQSEVIAVHRRIDSFEAWLKGMSDDLKVVTRPQPKYPLLFAAIGLATILLSIMTLAIAPIAANVSKIERNLHEHDDGHPQWVKQLVERVEKELSGRISILDAIHSDEHVEQEHDIGDLRAEDARFAQQVNAVENRITRLEAMLEQVSGKVVGRTAQGFHWREYEHLVLPDLERLDREILQLRQHHLMEHNGRGRTRSE